MEQNPKCKPGYTPENMKVMPIKKDDSQYLLQRISTMKSEEHACKYEDILLHLSEVIAAQDKELSDYRKLRFKLLCASFFDRIKWVFTGIKI